MRARKLDEERREADRKRDLYNERTQKVKRELAEHKAKKQE